MSATVVPRLYSNFRGVDFRGKEINLTRSPDSLNMWKDYKETESIRTRPSMQLKHHLGDHVYGILFYKDVMLVHCGRELFEIKDGEVKNITPHKFGEASIGGFIHKDTLYIITGSGFFSYNGDGKCEYVEGYVPTTSIGRKPSGGGTVHEDVNMLTESRINTFVGDGVSTEYYMDSPTWLGEDPLVKVNGKVMTSGYSWSADEAKITFDEPPPAPLTDGQDNVWVEFYVNHGMMNKIHGCRLVQVFDNRVFFSGNPDYPNMVWHSSLNDPTYISDLDYYQEGLDEALIRGVVAGNNALWVFREPSDANTSVFYHTPVIDDQYGKIYPSVHSSIATGCVGGAINFGDDIVFFSDRGMEGISGDITTEQAVAHRSSLVDRRLTAEPYYKNMVLVEWEGYLMVFIGDRCYLADSRAKFQNDDHFEYDWYYWKMEQNITSATVHDGVLYLGGEFGVYTLTGDADLESYWVTPLDKFKYPNMQKTTNKRGCVVEAEGEEISVFAKTNKEADFQLIGTYPVVTDAFVSRIKKKKFKDLQLKFYSPKRFSLETATMECFVGGYIKR